MDNSFLMNYLNQAESERKNAPTPSEAPAEEQPDISNNLSFYMSRTTQPEPLQEQSSAPKAEFSIPSGYFARDNESQQANPAPQEQAPVQQGFNIANYAESYNREQPVTEEQTSPAQDIPNPIPQFDYYGQQSYAYQQYEEQQTYAEPQAEAEPQTEEAAGVEQSGLAEQKDKKGMVKTMALLICACLLILVGIGLFISDKPSSNEDLLIPDENIEVEAPEATTP